MVISRSAIRRQTFFVLCIMVYRTILEAYYLIFTKDFAYYGLIYEPRELIESTFSWICLVISAYIVNVKMDRVSNSIHILLYLVCFVPSTVLYSMNQKLDGSYFYCLFLTFIVIGTQQYLFNGFKGVRQFSLSSANFKYLGLAMYLALWALVIWQYGFKFQIPSLSNVYEQRELFKAAEVSTAMKYALSWLAGVLNIAFVLHAALRKKYAWVLFGLIGALYFFSLGGQKSYLFAAPFTLGIFALVSRFRNDFNLALTLLFCASLVLLLLFDQFAEKGYSLISSLFIRRSLLLPSQIYYYYCEYFTENGLNLFAHTFLIKSVVNSPYQETAPVLIGERYFSFNADVYANGNVFADMFHNAGYFSYILISVLLPQVYMLIDYVSKNKPIPFTLPLLFMVAHVFINTGFVVTLVTHGLLLGILVVGFYPNNFFKIERRLIQPHK